MSSAIIDRLGDEVRAKSTGTSLRSHLAVTGQVARVLLAVAEYPVSSDVLVAAASLHDLGKARRAFQEFLDGGSWRCHEEDAPETIREFLMDHPSREWLAQVLGSELPLPSTEGQVNDIIAFAVTHHGRRQYSPADCGDIAGRVVTLRRSVAPGLIALTEFDLLYRYRPHGGVVILADQIASALQEGRLGVLVSTDPAECSAASPLADLPDEAAAALDEPGSAALLPQGSGLQRLFLDGLGIERVEAIREDAGWHLIVDRSRTELVRSNM